MFINGCLSFSVASFLACGGWSRAFSTGFGVRTDGDPTGWPRDRMRYWTTLAVDGAEVLFCFAEPFFAPVFVGFGERFSSSLETGGVSWVKPRARDCLKFSGQVTFKGCAMSVKLIIMEEMCLEVKLVLKRNNHVYIRPSSREQHYTNNGKLTLERRHSASPLIDRDVPGKEKIHRLGCLCRAVLKATLSPLSWKYQGMRTVSSSLIKETRDTKRAMSARLQLLIPHVPTKMLIWTLTWCIDHHRTIAAHH